MTDAGWTSKKPTVAGFYWWKRPGYAPTIAEVYGPPGGLLLWLPGEDTTREESISVAGAYDDTEFLGPISPTDRQRGRIEGLREYRDVVARELQLDHNNHPTRFKASIIEALDKADFEVLAQAAQDEKPTKEDL